jgi:hypothetical protein
MFDTILLILSCLAVLGGILWLIIKEHQLRKEEWEREEQRLREYKRD